jgi:hypothetical protein
MYAQSRQIRVGAQPHTRHWRGVQTQNVVEIGTELPYDHGHL